MKECITIETACCCFYQNMTAYNIMQFNATAYTYCGLEFNHSITIQSGSKKDTLALKMKKLIRPFMHKINKERCHSFIMTYFKDFNTF